MSGAEGAVHLTINSVGNWELGIGNWELGIVRIAGAGLSDYWFEAIVGKKRPYRYYYNHCPPRKRQ
ncbi:hypothetical protein QUB61_22920 [Microcoleus sp. C2D2]